MTKKHFIALALIIKKYHEAEKFGYSFNLAEAVADWLQSICPRFDYSRFIEACEPKK